LKNERKKIEAEEKKRPSETVKNPAIRARKKKKAGKKRTSVTVSQQIE